MSELKPIPLEVLSEVITVGQVTCGIAPQEIFGFPVLVIYVNGINLIDLSSLDWRWTFSVGKINYLKKRYPESSEYLHIFLEVCSKSNLFFKNYGEYSISRSGTNTHQVMQEFSTAIDKLFGDILK